MKKLILIIGMAAFSISVFSQEKWNWPEDPDMKDKAEENNVLYSDYVKIKNYKEAQKPHLWLLKNVPDLNPAIYINGATIYHALQKQETDPERKIRLQDSALLMFDQRIEYFNKKPQVLNRKGYFVYLYYRDRKDLDSYKYMYETLKKAFELNGDNIWTNNLVAFMDAARRYKLLGGDMDNLGILDTYNKVISIIDHKEKNGEDPKKAEVYRKNVDKILAATITLTCEQMEKEIGSQLTEDDFDKAFLYLRLVRSKKCTDNASYLKSIKIVHSYQPEYTWAKYIALKSKQDKDYLAAEKYFNEALDLVEIEQQKADIYLNLADLAAAKGQKASARSHAYKAMEIDPSKKEGYAIIGRLYMNSFHSQ